MSLPAELRLKIYGCILKLNGELYYSTVFHPAGLTFLIKNLYIWLVCWQICEEVTEFVFERSVVTISVESTKVMEAGMTRLPFIGLNCRRVRRLILRIIPQEDVEFMEHLVDVARFLEKYFPPGEEENVKLKLVGVCFRQYYLRKNAQ